MSSVERPGLSPAVRHRLESVGRACALLKAFANNEEDLALTDLVSRAGLEKTIAFRLVHTLEAEGFLRRVGSHRYCLNIKMLSKKPFCIGYAAEGADSLFSLAVSESVRWAATRNEVDLIFLDNHYSPRTALRNAERLIAERVDLAIDFQAYAKIAATISSLFRKVGIPLITVGVPHPGAVFYGVDNYRAGIMAGHALIKWAKQHWRGTADRLLLLGGEIFGSLPQLRLAGAAAPIREGLPGLGNVLQLDTRGEFLPALDVVRRHLRLSPPRRTLLVGVNDEAVLGGLRAFEEAGRSEFCAAVALGGVLQARAELRVPGTRLIGCVAFFPERYGESLMRLALSILHKKRVPPAVQVQPQMITTQNVDHFYPADGAEVGWDPETL